MVLTADLVNEFLRDKDKLMCHKYADQAVAMWIYKSMKSNPVTWFGDTRIHHDPPASYVYSFKLRQEICHTYLSVHGSYPEEMRYFQDIFEKERRNLGLVYDVPAVKDFCVYGRDNFLWHKFTRSYYAEPLPCRDEPIWVSDAGIYNGRRDRVADHEKELPPTPKQKVRFHHIIQNIANKNKSGEAMIIRQIAVSTQENIGDGNAKTGNRSDGIS